MSPVVETTPAAPGRRRRYLPGTWRGWLIVIAIVICLPLLAAYILARQTPSWYRPLDPNSVQVMDAEDLGRQKLESELHNSLQRVALGDQLWTISQTEVNSVLAVQFAPPLNPDGTRSYPAGKSQPEVSQPFVMFSPGKITVAARTTRIPGPGPGGGVASITFSVATVPAAGGGRGGATNGLVKMEGARAGILPIPKSMVESKVRSLMPGLLAAIKQAYPLQLRNSSTALPEIDATVGAIEKEEAFPLRFHTFVIREIRVDEGSLSVIFGSPIPPGVRPRPLPAGALPAR